MPTISPHFGYSLRAELGLSQLTPRSEGRFAPMKRKGAPAKDGKCPRDAPKDEKCDNCRSKKGACLVAARIAAGKALPSPDEPSTSKPRPTQPVADSDMDIDRPNTRPSRQCQPPRALRVRRSSTKSGDWTANIEVDVLFMLGTHDVR